MRILITGGHIAPALALIDSLQQSKKNVNLVFVGRQLSFEYKEIIKRKISFIPINAGRLTRLISLRSLINFLKFPLGLIQSLIIIRKEKPDKILSFGGYIALPIVLAGYLNKIPAYTHEQTIRPGLSNRIIGLIAKKVFCSFQGSLSYFPSKKAILTGNPIRKEIFQVKKKINLQKSKPVIYITGGSLGSHSINLHIEKIINILKEKYIIIHQAGDIKEYQDFERLSRFKNENYNLVKHFFDDEIGYIFLVADLIISRAGANIFFELLTLKKPTIFIPLPWSANQEQLKQAEIFQKNGIGEIFDQNEPSENLIKLIDKTIKNLDKYKKNFQNLKFLNQPNAAQIIIDEIYKS